MRACLVSLALVLCACSSAPSDPAVCQGVLLTHLTGLTNPHVATCSDPTCGNGSNPPVGGPHCPTPLACTTYSTAQPRCAWIHNLEHGHLVLAYNCPQGCPEVVSALQAIADAQPAGTNGIRRVLITPDPELPTEVAAVVWGWSWTGGSVDPQAIDCLITHQDEDAPEAGLACAPP